MLSALVTACGSTKVFIPRTEVVAQHVDPALLEHVRVDPIDVRTNEDLDRKAVRFEAALGECNARLDDIAAADAMAPVPAPARPWWKFW